MKIETVIEIIIIPNRNSSEDRNSNSNRNNSCKLTLIT